LEEGPTPGGCIIPTVATSGQALQILRKDYSWAVEKNAARKALLKIRIKVSLEKILYPGTRIKNKKEKVILHLLQKRDSEKKDMANNKKNKKKYET
jgi:hypothetical protein